MPGPNLTQQPIIQIQELCNAASSPKSSVVPSSNLPLNGPNPWWPEINVAILRLFLVESYDQNQAEIQKYVVREDRLKLAGQVLEWSQYIAPTAPDTRR
jgi:hypothetical protein